MITLPFELTRPLVFIDLETTGTDPKTDRIVEISLVFCMPGGEVDVRTRRVHPEIPIPAEATAVHGITDDDVATEPAFCRFASDLLLKLDGCDIAGFNVRQYDLPLLMAEFERCGSPFDHRGRRIIDTQQIFHREEPRDLTAAVLLYLGRSHEGAHGAESDALASAEVLAAQIERYGLSTDLDELHAYCDEYRPFETEFDRWFDTTVSDNPREWLFKRGKHRGDQLGKQRSYLEWLGYKTDAVHPDVVRIAREVLLGRYG